MFAIPGFDPKTLNDNELFEKQLDLVRKKLQAAAFGKMDMVNQLQSMITAIDIERRERIFQERIGTYIMTSSPVLIETDPVLKERDANAEETVTVEKPKKVDQSRPVKIPVRTKRPVNPKESTDE